MGDNLNLHFVYSHAVRVLAASHEPPLAFNDWLDGQETGQNQQDQNQQNENQPNENQPNENQPNENQPDENQPGREKISGFQGCQLSSTRFWRPRSDWHAHLLLLLDRLVA